MRWQGEERLVEKRFVSDVVEAEVEDSVSSLAVLVFAVVSFLFSGMFWSLGITGNVVLGVGGVGGGLIGVVFFLSSVFGFFVYAKKREEEVL